MRANDVMTPDVVTVTQDAHVHDIARLLLERHISAVPVVDSDDRVLGIVSEGDLMRRRENETERHSSWWLALWTMPKDGAREYVEEHGTRARDVMTRDVVTVTEDTPLGEIAERLEELRIKRVPVVRDGRLVGIVSRANLLHGLATARRAMTPSPTPDDRSIRERVVEALHEDLGVTTECINVTVSDGIVDLWGDVDSGDEKQAILIAARNTPGVRELRDHIFVPTQFFRSLSWGV